MIKRALISVSDKTGIVDVARELEEMGVEIISTGGTKKTLEEEGIKVISVEDVTGFPECLNGRVKTLHPGVMAGLLAKRDNEEHMQHLFDLSIEPIDMIIVNLYPFKNTILREGCTFEEAIENIDIGGPTMLRAAAKNFQDVAVVIDPSDYDVVLGELREKGEVSYDTKLNLAKKVFMSTSYYDTLIASYLREQVGDDSYPETLTLCYDKAQDLRYGENPHQDAVFYKEVRPMIGSLPLSKQLHGKELSYNNINDTNGALEILKEYSDEPTIVAVKHANPCGIASDASIAVAFKKCYEADPQSIFGGIIASNEEIDEETALQISNIFIEVVVAPSYTDEALKILTKKKNIRILQLDDIKHNQEGKDIKKVMGGLLMQARDTKLLSDELKVVTKRQPTNKEMQDLIFSWKAVKHTKSNAISIAKDKILVANGPGQVSRIWALENAVKQGGESVKGAVLASDAFFPFDDCVKAAYEAGITAIIQPGGSIRDEDSIKACNEYGIAMVFTGVRHFKHS
ncbi:bifunctional phosphoribosylaminoimidazolecarboxamide formyltransferase/IMP cyclohydrolase [Anaerofustis stercorihominis]|uniref:bifunctional phosphoribosylaminoimidazolecarboxamide formyltransferase/IMP cyclohydrolase n=1 Tax=Anaerofustis stercorihominis TaxID=214853 RepID=UPI00214CBE3A|nr:bifunctional phosphoribosylaminoimidazolecarboxamide formyltransferase/IMP cyclohydrolase [Anaerofustis stercorihominis]MCR2033038.1 bifunctional phosphoribosylaminoimidazolecarboxamide formyltransferase/IMP cyclohydrolase [Anaerofustis stercorihominis]